MNAAKMRLELIQARSYSCSPKLDFPASFVAKKWQKRRTCEIYTLRFPLSSATTILCSRPAQHTSAMPHDCRMDAWISSVGKFTTLSDESHELPPRFDVVTSRVFPATSTLSTIPPPLSDPSIFSMVSSQHEYYPKNQGPSSANLRCVWTPSRGGWCLVDV